MPERSPEVGAREVAPLMAGLVTLTDFPVPGYAGRVSLRPPPAVAIL